MEQKHFFPFRHFRMYFRNFRKDAKPDGIRTVHFLKSEWESFEVEDRVSAGYLVYRVMFMACFVGIFTFNFSCYSTVPPNFVDYFFIYLTNWSFLFATLYSIVFCGRVVVRRCLFRPRVRPDPERKGSTTFDIEATTSVQEPSSGIASNMSQALTSPQNVEQKRRPRHFKNNSLSHVDRGIWLTFEMVFILAQTVTLGYWIFLHRGRKHEAVECGNHAYYFSHGLNCLLLTVDIFVVAIPVRLFHGLYTILFALIYGIFTGIYEVAGGSYPGEKQGAPYIYNFLNWREKAKYVAIVPFAAFFLLSILHLLMMFLFSLRLLIVSQARPKLNVYYEHFYDYTKQEPEPEVPENNNLREEPNQSTTEAVAPEDTKRLEV